MLTVSTSVSRRERDDASGELLAHRAEEAGAEVVAMEVVPDDFALIEDRLLHYVDEGVSFIFTTCSGSCPATTHRLSQVQQALKDRRLLADDRVRLLSITLDPARDSAEVLRGYSRRYDADPSSWSFLTGSPAEVEKVVAAWGMWARPADNGQLDHPSRIFLVDRPGRIREIYNLDYLKPSWVVDDIELLLKEE